MRVSTEFYKSLYTTEKVNYKVQEKLLRNVKTKLSKEKQTELDKPFSDKEVWKAIQNLPNGKSPVEFYKEF